MQDHDFILLFQHTAKTGGTTLGEVLSKAYASEKRLWITSGRQSKLGLFERSEIGNMIAKTGAKRLNGIRQAGGHIPFGVHNFFDREAKYITLVRHPVERVISGYFYGMQMQGIKDATTEDLHRFVSMESEIGIDNYSVRVLSGNDRLDSFDKACKIADLDPVTREDLEACKRNIEAHFLAAGISEALDEFLILLSSMLQIPWSTILIQRMNVTKNRPKFKDLNAETLKVIEARNLYDFELYKFVCDRFKRQLTEAGPRLASDIAAIRSCRRMIASGESIDKVRRFADQAQKVDPGDSECWPGAETMVAWPEVAENLRSANAPRPISAGDIGTDHTAAHVFDGDDRTYWESNQDTIFGRRGGIYLGYDFGAGHSLTPKSIFLHQSFAGDSARVDVVEIQCSDDRFFNHIVSIHRWHLPLDQGGDRVDLSSVRQKARYWRIVARSADPDGRWRVNELRFELEDGEQAIKS